MHALGLSRWFMALSIVVFALPSFAHAHEEQTVRIDKGGFSPENIEVSTGDTVVFINDDTEPHWVASNVHPTHTSYPGSDIRLCAKEGTTPLFDACKGMEKGEVFRFTFTEPGTWRYHDHLNANLGGTIIVTATGTDAGTQEYSVSKRGGDLGLVQKVATWFLRQWYVVFPHAAEKKLNSLDLIDIATTDSNLEYWMRVYGYDSLLDELERDTADPLRTSPELASEGLIRSCHVEAHFIGRLAVKLLGITAHDERTLDTRCHLGFYHGVIEASLGNLGDDAVVRDVAGKCAEYTEEPLRRIFCEHVIGHGIVVYHDYDLPEAIEKCRTLMPSRRAATMCVHGAFMENVFVTLGFGVGDHSTVWMDAARPDFPCTSGDLPSDMFVRQQCYFNQTAFWGRPLENFNVSEAIAGCVRAPDDVRDVCFRGIGYNMTMPMSPLTDKETESRCGESPTNKDKNECLLGALLMRSFFWQDYDGFKNPSLCLGLGFENLDACDSYARDKFQWIFE